MISKFYQDVNSLGLKFPVAAIAKETGYSKGNVSGYLKGNPPSENFISAFYRKFSDRLDKVPKNGTTATEATQISTISKNKDTDTRKNKLTTVTGQIDYGMKPTANGTKENDAVIAVRILAETSKIDSETISKLTDLVTKLIKK